ncbi:MAG: NodT protein, partial [Methylococcales bacterium]
MVGPDYNQPPDTTPKHWSVKTPVNNTAIANAKLATWWHIFADPILSGLMARAQQSNLDLRQAQARLREARARRGLAQA